MENLLEFDKEQNKLSFYREVSNLEFTGKIGNIDIHTNPQKRDKMLIKHGKRMFRKVKPARYTRKRKRGARNYHILCPSPQEAMKGKRGEVLSQEEIDMLLGKIRESCSEVEVLSPREKEELLTPLKKG